MANRSAQGVRDAQLPAEADGARRQPPERKTGIAGLIQRITALRPVRVFQFFATKDGALLSSGLSYQAIFALFAALWFTFSIAGFVIKGNAVLQNTLVSAINTFVPGLIGTGSGSAVKIGDLLKRD